MHGLAIFLGIAFSSLALGVPKKTPQVFTAKLMKTSIKQTLLFPSLVKSRIESNVRADGDFIVVRSLVGLGQKVKKGDALLELANQDTSLNFHHRILKSPVAGTVASLLVSTGEYVQRGHPLVHVNDPERIYLKLELPVINLAQVTTGMLAIVKMPGEDSLKARVTGIGAVLDPKTGTVPVELEFIEKPKSLVPGSVTNVELIAAEKELILVPEKAIYYSGDQTFLPVLQDGIVKKVKVKTKPAANGNVEILDGAALDSEVVVGSGEFLKDGDKVDVIKKN